jgi:hypothetical protein
MKIAPIFVLQFVLFAFGAPFAYPQSSVVYEKELKSTSLSGTVYLENASREGLKGILIEECSSDWKSVKQAIHTNEKGHFAFADHSDRGLHYVRLSAPGFRQTFFKVRITMWTKKKQLFLPLSVAM